MKLLRGRAAVAEPPARRGPAEGCVLPGCSPAPQLRASPARRAVCPLTRGSILTGTEINWTREQCYLRSCDAQNSEFRIKQTVQ